MGAILAKNWDNSKKVDLINRLSVDGHFASKKHKHCGFSAIRILSSTQPTWFPPYVFLWMIATQGVKSKSNCGRLMPLIEKWDKDEIGWIHFRCLQIFTQVWLNSELYILPFDAIWKADGVTEKLTDWCGCKYPFNFFYLWNRTIYFYVQIKPIPKRKKIYEFIIILRTTPPPQQQW